MNEILRALIMIICEIFLLLNKLKKFYLTFRDLSKSMHKILLRFQEHRLKSIILKNNRTGFLTNSNQRSSTDRGIKNAASDPFLKLIDINFK